MTDTMKTSKVRRLNPVRSLLLGLLVALAPLSVQGQGMVENAETQARVLAREGGAAFRGKQYDVALAKFLAAWKLVQHPNLAINIGRTYEKLDELDKAMAFCRRALESPQLPPRTEQAATACVNRIRPKISDPILEVRSTPEGADVRIDGQAKGKTPWRGEIPIGKHQVDVTLKGFGAERREVFGVRGKDQKLTVVLLPEAVGGVISIVTLPEGADVVLDGEVVGQTPLEGLGMPPRRYVMELRLAGYRPHVMPLLVEDGQLVRREIALIADDGTVGPKRPDWPAWTLMGTGVAVGALGGYFGFQALSARDDADTLARTSVDPADKIRYDELVDTMDTNRVLSDTLIGAGSALVIGGLVWLLWPD